MSVRLFVVWRRVKKKNVSRRKSKTNERTKKERTHACPILRSDATKRASYLVRSPSFIICTPRECVCACFFVVLSYKNSSFLQNVTRIFESHAKGESRDQKSFGPADKKKSKANFLTEKVRARE